MSASAAHFSPLAELRVALTETVDEVPHSAVSADCDIQTVSNEHTNRFGQSPRISLTQALEELLDDESLSRVASVSNVASPCRVDVADTQRSVFANLTQALESVMEDDYFYTASAKATVERSIGPVGSHIENHVTGVAASEACIGAALHTSADSDIMPVSGYRHFMDRYTVGSLTQVMQEILDEDDIDVVDASVRVEQHQTTNGDTAAQERSEAAQTQDCRQCNRELLESTDSTVCRDMSTKNCGVEELSDTLPGIIDAPECIGGTALDSDCTHYRGMCHGVSSEVSQEALGTHRKDVAPCSSHGGLNMFGSCAQTLLDDETSEPINSDAQLASAKSMSKISNCGIGCREDVSIDETRILACIADASIFECKSPSNASAGILTSHGSTQALRPAEASDAHRALMVGVTSASQQHKSQLNPWSLSPMLASGASPSVDDGPTQKDGTHEGTCAATARDVASKLTIGSVLSTEAESKQLFQATALDSEADEAGITGGSLAEQSSGGAADAWKCAEAERTCTRGAIAERGSADEDEANMAELVPAVTTPRMQTWHGSQCILDVVDSADELDACEVPRQIQLRCAVDTPSKCVDKKRPRSHVEQPLEEQPGLKCDRRSSASSPTPPAPQSASVELEWLHKPSFDKRGHTASDVQPGHHGQGGMPATSAVSLDRRRSLKGASPANVSAGCDRRNVLPSFQDKRCISAGARVPSEAYDFAAIAAKPSATEKRARPKASHCSARKSKVVAGSWEATWKELAAKGWREEYGPRGNAQQVYYMPPGVQRGHGYKCRVHYFDSRVLVLRYLDAQK